MVAGLKASLVDSDQQAMQGTPLTSQRWDVAEDRAHVRSSGKKFEDEIFPGRLSMQRASQVQGFPFMSSPIVSSLV